MRALRKQNLSGKVHVVRDGAEALDFLFAMGTYIARKVDNRPKVVLLDLKLPKVDGIEVLRKMKNDNRTRNIPVVMLTSSQEERDVVESYRLGVNSYMVKPVDFSNFVHAVSELGVYWGLLNKVPYQ
jgi:two-component system, response regulator